MKKYDLNTWAGMILIWLVSLMFLLNKEGPQVKEIHTLDVIGIIEETTYLTESAKKIKALQEGDEVTVKINTIGGDAYTTLKLVDALQTTKATVKIIVDKKASSGGGMIAISRPQDLELTPDDVIMVHYPVYGNSLVDRLMGRAYATVPKGLYPEVDRTRDIIDRLYKGLITPEEQQRMDEGKQVFIDAQALSARLCINRGICDALKP